MKASLEAFYNNQFRRDEEVLTILRKREVEMEGNLLKKIQAFKYLYKEQFKEFGKLMKIEIKNWKIMMFIEEKSGMRVWI